MLRVGRTGNLRVASAGHLPALVCRPDGTASYVTARPTPPIGLRYVGPRPEASASIEPGTWLAVFTDGLVEQRGEPIDDGLERVRLLATALAGHDPDTVADRLLAALVGEHPRDDVALVVVRFAG